MKFILLTNLIIGIVFFNSLYAQTSSEIEKSKTTLAILNPMPSYDGEEYDRIYDSRSAMTPAHFNGSRAEFKHFLRCCLDQSVLTKDHVEGKELKVVVEFVIGKNGEPYNIVARVVPLECPDCGEAALRLLYKHVTDTTENSCDIKITDKPYKQWIPGTRSGGQYVHTKAFITVPFGFYDEALNTNLFVDYYKEDFKNWSSWEGRNDFDAEKKKSQNEIDAENSNLSPESITAANDITYIKASVLKQGGKYILTVLGDKSTHTVFRPIPKAGDVAMMNKYNNSIPLNQGAWGEVATSKSGTPIVKFYSFTGADNAISNAMTLEDFKKGFYEPK